MNKIILAIPVFVLSSSFTIPMETATAAEHRNFNKVSKSSKSKIHRSRQPAKFTKFPRRAMASWYGPKFHGKKTASGQKFDMYAMTAAHKTLPLLSYAKVTNPENHLSVIVRINDRGPYHGKRSLDLSFAAAKKIGIAGAGVGEVIIKPLEREQALSLLNDGQNAIPGG